MANKNRVRLATLPPRLCKICGTPFRPKMKLQKCCTPQCTRLAFRRGRQPPVETFRDPGRQERIALYTERASRGLPLFEHCATLAQ